MNGKSDGSGFLTINDTNVLKGFALVLLLSHHLFTTNNENWYDVVINGQYYPVVSHIGGLSNICVALFVLLSGYGLGRQVNIKGMPNLYKFYKRRFTKLMLNFWFVFVIFVSIDIFIFGRNMDEVYGGHSVVLKFLADFLGLTFFFPFYGFNPTWWFMSLIILLYLVFPFIYQFATREHLLCVFLFSLIALIPWSFEPAIMLNFMFAFCIGTILSLKPLVFKNRKIIFILIFTIALGLCLRTMFYSTYMYYDGIVSASILYMYIYIKEFISKFPKLINNVFAFIGKHSMNIFLFHTFIFYFWFKDFIYCFKYPIVILFVLLIICLSVSYILESLKKAIRFEEIVKVFG